LQNYPNPFNSSTIISYQIPQKSFVNLSVYNAAGQLLENLENRDVPPGNYSIVWDSKDVGTGIFFIKLSADAFVFTRKMLVVK
jgi:hypothetical protein